MTTDLIIDEVKAWVDEAELAAKECREELQPAIDEDCTACNFNQRGVDIIKALLAALTEDNPNV